MFAGLLVGVWGLFHNYAEAATYQSWQADLRLRAMNGDGKAGEKLILQENGIDIYPGPKGAASIDWPFVVLGFALFVLGGGALVRTIVLSGGQVRCSSSGDTPRDYAPNLEVRTTLEERIERRSI
jgi:hypothetical protein